MENASLAVVNSLRTVTDSLSAMSSWLLNEILQGGDSADPTDEMSHQAVTAEEVRDYMRSAKLSVVYLLAGPGKGE